MRLEDVGEFVAWLRRPLVVRGAAVAVLPSVEHHCCESTVNRKLSALSAFYQHAAPTSGRGFVSGWPTKASECATMTRLSARCVFRIC